MACKGYILLINVHHIVNYLSEADCHIGVNIKAVSTELTTLFHIYSCHNFYPIYHHPNCLTVRHTYKTTRDGST